MEAAPNRQNGALHVGVNGPTEIIPAVAEFSGRRVRISIASLLEACQGQEDGYLYVPTVPDGVPEADHTPYTFYGGRVVMYPGSRRVEFVHQEVALREREFDLLDALGQHAGTPKTYEQLLKEVWSSQFYVLNTVRMAVSRIRQSMGSPGVIRSIPRVGYVAPE